MIVNIGAYDASVKQYEMRDASIGVLDTIANR